MVARNVQVDGLPVRWEEQGEGRPVVFLHGIPTSPALWRDVIPQVSARCLAFELVGYAASIPVGRDRDISVAAQAGYVWDWLDTIGVEQPVLVGHDLGGGVAQIAAVERPNDVAGLVLTNAISYDSWPVPAVKAMRAASGLVARAPTPMFKAMLASFVARGHDRAEVARASFQLHWRHYAGHGGAAAMARQVSSLDVRDTLRIADRLPELDLPTRIVWGLDDQFQRPRYGERLARDLGTRPVGIPGAKHFTPENHPDVIAAAVRSLVAELEPGT